MKVSVNNQLFAKLFSKAEGTEKEKEVIVWHTGTKKASMRGRIYTHTLPTFSSQASLPTPRPAVSPLMD